MTVADRRTRTSISDDDGLYLDCVRSALSDEAIFNNFRMMPGIRDTVEGKVRHGETYRTAALRQSPHLWDYLDRFKTSDAVGNPETMEFPEGAIGGATWRYIKVLSDLQTLFGSLDGWRIAEIGVGYGGQCKIIGDVHDVAAYVMFDLEPVLRLSRKYLERVGSPVIDRLMFADFQRLGETQTDSYDLVISNFALSECTKEIQDRYVEGVLRRSRCGYITYNQISSLCNVESYRADEFCNRLGMTIETKYEDLSAPEYPEPWQSFIMHWGSSARSIP